MYIHVYIYTHTHTCVCVIIKSIIKINNLSFHIWKMERKRRIKSKESTREIIKVRSEIREISEIENRKSLRKKKMFL